MSIEEELLKAMLEPLSPATQWFVHSSDGVDYKVGRWHMGVWLPGGKGLAIANHTALAEPGSYVWGKRVNT